MSKWQAVTVKTNNKQANKEYWSTQFQSEYHQLKPYWFGKEAPQCKKNHSEQTLSMLDNLQHHYDYDLFFFRYQRV